MPLNNFSFVTLPEKEVKLKLSVKIIGHMEFLHAKYGYTNRYEIGQVNGVLGYYIIFSDKHEVLFNGESNFDLLLAKIESYRASHLDDNTLFNKFDLVWYGQEALTNDAK